ncbi:MAPEG family protein [Lutibaculum baratangense]|uniref:MAPEG family protein n=1 Tax=Lutibaculum baratangense AMV1 TaxID=631454 RepID=V4TAG1_9HYPH|nr:MAPEG family protein [Lutibaculum baratangense]ESR23418.1 hypothetical protein N177_3486 [Lutibaculum baratangense AMV1]
MSLASGLLALALLGQVLLTLVVYLVMGRRRYAAAARGEVSLATYVLVRDEPPALARITKNLANQFELPVLFYALALLLVALGAASLLDALVAWVFVASRIAHAYVAIGSENVRLRARIFQFGVLMVGLLAIHSAFIVIASMT